jgi:DNA-binding CsgD family transcriptional regulator
MELTIKRAPNGYRIGDSHQRSEFTDREVELMRQLRDGGMGIEAIAERFGATKGYVWKICTFQLRRGGR